MTNPYQNLSERIRDQVADLERVVERALDGWSLAQNGTPEQFAYLDSVALSLHGFFSGIERLFELIARQVDREMPESVTWHRDLVQQMTRDLPGIRPAVISPSSASGIDEYRRFRHLVRNVYAIDLVPEKMVGLMVALPNVWPGLHSELMAFADFLDALGAASHT